MVTKERIEIYFKEEGIKIDRGFVYNFYTCGCIFKQSESKKVRRTYTDKKTGKQKAYIVCDVCKKGTLSIKFKICPSCGSAQCGMKLTDSRKCAKCPKEILTPKFTAEEISFEKKRLEEAVIKIQASEDRSDCALRLNCLDKYKKNLKIKFLPCDGCRKYKAINFEVDALAGVYKHGIVMKHSSKVYGQGGR